MKNKHYVRVKVTLGRNSTEIAFFCEPGDSVDKVLAKADRLTENLRRFRPDDPQKLEIVQRRRAL